MAAKVKFFIKTVKEVKNSINNDEVNIRLRFSNGRSFDLTAQSGKQINPDYWNNEKGIVRQRAAFTNSIEFQKGLDSIKAHILKEFDETADKSIINAEWLIKTIDKFYNPNKYLQNNHTLFSYIQYFVANADKRINPKTGNPICYKMQREYEVTFEYLKKYAEIYGEPDFADIDLDFYQKFLEVLRNEDLQPNTVGKKVQTLKIFLNAATEIGINHHLKYKSKNFKTISEEADNIYLTKEEIQKLYEYDLSKNPSYERVRDVFVVGCWTGLRYSDLPQMELERVDNDIIKITQQKTGNKATIPIHPIVNEILEKYDGKLPKAISNQKFNDYIKKVAEEAKINSIIVMNENRNGVISERHYFKHELISSHTVRRSFCTNAYKDGIPSIAIMAISGHTTEKAFLKYIKADKEEHARIVLDVWKNDKYKLKKNINDLEDYSI